MGFDRHDVAQVAEAIRAEDALRLRGIYTHMRVEARPDARGMKNQEIARALFISPSTTKVHVRHILEKLGVRTRAEAVLRLEMFS